MLWLYRRIIFGELVKEDLKNMLDLSLREKVIFAPLLLLVLLDGHLSDQLHLDLRADGDGLHPGLRPAHGCGRSRSRCKRLSKARTVRP